MSVRLPVAATLLAATGSLACARHVPRTHRVAMQNIQMVPASIVAAVGDTVEWVNADFVPHTATARDSSWDSKTIDGGGTWRLVVRTTGHHPYYCVFHPTMQGDIDAR